jgi:hypothetical protein
MSTSIWFFTLLAINTSGEASISNHWPQQPQYNTEQECKTTAQAEADRLQAELGTKNATVFWHCDAVDFKLIEKLIGQPI